MFSATSAVHGKASSNSAVKKLMARAGMRNPVMINVAIARAPEPSSSTASTKDDNEDVEMKNSSSSSDQQKSESSSSNSTVALHEQATPTTLTNYYCITSLEQKTDHLISFIQSHSDQNVVIFFLTCACVEFYGLALPQFLANQKMDTHVEMLHGKLSPKRREKAMERFRAACEIDTSNDVDVKDQAKKKGKGAILLCTDIAARGLDIPHIEWTIQYDAPSDPTQYVHRVGRSARAGRFGSSLIFLSSKEESFVDFLQIRKVPLQELTAESLVTVGGGSGSGAITLKKASATLDDNDDKLDSSTISTATNKAVNDSKTSKVLEKIKRLVMKDRDLLEKGTKAYTSYIRAYKEHKCSFIFR